MTYWQQVLEVARWEFARFVKWKQQLVGLALMLALGVGGGVVGRAVKRAELKPVPVAVVGGDAAPFAAIVMPALVGTSAFVVIGVLQLRGAGRASIRETRARFERPARWTTFTLGLLIAVLILVAGFRDPLLSNLVSIIALFAVVVGIAGARI